MKFLLLVIDLIMYTICIHTYLISRPRSYLNFPHLSFLMQAWVFIQQFRHVLGATYFRMEKFCKSMSDYLINCVHIAFAYGLYSIGVLHIPKNFPRRRTWFLGHTYFILGKLKDSFGFWNGVSIMG